LRAGSIRNFCIIAHIDHGKSTLADRLLEATGAISERERRDQILDAMDLERERGITIKASAVTIDYERDGQQYMLNLIDTPGHVDFHYEVSRALTACEGALLVVDASQGVEAQTVANAYLAMEHDLRIIPVVNKIDLPSARPEDVAVEVEHALALPSEECIFCSAKSGVGIDELIQAIIRDVPPPKGDPEAPLKALIFDAEYNDYRGVIIYIRVFEGRIKVGQKIRLMGVGREHVVQGLGKFRPAMAAFDELSAGEVGYCVANIKTLDEVDIGDTVADMEHMNIVALPGYRQPQQMVFCDIYPTATTDYERLRDSLERLRLNDASFNFRPKSSEVLGFGFGCGFLGLLHMDIIQERLERESGVDLVQTAPTTSYEVVRNSGEMLRIDSPSDMPPMAEVQEIREPMVRGSMIIPVEAIGNVMHLAENRRGVFVRQEHISPTRVVLVFDFPLAETIYDFYDKLKSCTRGYGTVDYEFLGFFPADLVCVDILVNGKPASALNFICHRDTAEGRGRRILQRLKKEIPRHQFLIPLQAAIGSRVIARETISALRKNVTAKCYGGDVTRKRKLLEKQKEGKKRMKSIGNVELPQKAFLAVLETE
jgi:GTP-binding protein LepA